MLYGVSLGPGDAELVTLRAKKVIEQVDEVIVPGRLAENVVRNYREDVRVVEFPMGNAEKIVDVLSSELAQRCVEEDIAFCVLGDVAFFSTFQDVFHAVKQRNPGVDVELVPGVPSFTAVFSKLKRFVDSSFRVSSALDGEERYVVVLKAVKSLELAETLRNEGYRVVQVERMFMEGESIGEPKEKSSYFTLLVGWR
ncbi:SAM-dependent methyltransferase [Geoglobus acetivorans]|uniref:Cobalt-precorrin-2 C20-methyltransferase n=1 Tax=Geoglobus acetivorans TaxID=565033 RepID=A0A0A7GGA2_GEOAI|nr:Cobalt-precorrin-2 C20-methyltransferase [Geoglobus acetivorans]